MPCPIEEELREKVGEAERRYLVAADPGVNKWRALGEKKAREQESMKKRDLQVAEARYNMHIASCDICKADGRREVHLSRIPK